MDNTSFAPGNNSVNNSVPPLTPQYSSPEPKHLPKLLTWIVLILALGLSAFAGIWFWQDQQVGEDYPVVFTPRPPDPTADWKTYTNTEYGFEFKYPANWEVLDDTTNLQTLLSLRDKKYSGSMEWPGLKIVSGTPNDYQGTQGDFKTAVSGKIFAQSPAVEVPPTLKIYFDLGNKRIYASCTVYTVPETLSLCNQILSTFKFIDITPTLSSSSNSPRTSQEILDANTRRVAQLSSIRTGLELYHDDHSLYPAPIGTTAQDRWTSLGKEILANVQYWNGGWPQDPNWQNGYSYDYGTNPDRESFVIKATMELSNSEALKMFNPTIAYPHNMNQGTIFSVDCSGSSFCIYVKP